MLGCLCCAGLSVWLLVLRETRVLSLNRMRTLILKWIRVGAPLQLVLEHSALMLTAKNPYITYDWQNGVAQRSLRRGRRGWKTRLVPVCSLQTLILKVKALKLHLLCIA